MHLTGASLMERTRAPEHSALQGLHGLRITSSLPSAFLPLVALESPATLRSGTGCDHHAFFPAELGSYPGSLGDLRPGSSPGMSPRGLLLSYPPNLEVSRAPEHQSPSSLYLRPSLTGTQNSQASVG